MTKKQSKRGSKKSHGSSARVSHKAARSVPAKAKGKGLLTLVAFLLDETGSMLSRKSAVLSGFNEYLLSLKKPAQKVLFSLTKFNSAKTELPYVAAPLSQVEPLTERTYQPDATTPLYDAIAATIQAAEQKDHGADRVLCVILTDGLENASQRYTLTDVLRMIREKESTKRWTFAYLGANQDAWAVGVSMGIPQQNTQPYDPQKVVQTFTQLGKSTARYMATSDTASADFFRGWAQ